MTDMPEDQTRHGERPVGGHEHRHGRPVSWVLVAVIVAAFCAGGAAIIGRLWWLFWLCAGIVVLCVPVGKLIGIMNDTVVAEQGSRALPPTDGQNSAAHPGVQLD